METECLPFDMLKVVSRAAENNERIPHRMLSPAVGLSAVSADADSSAYAETLVIQLAVSDVSGQDTGVSWLGASSCISSRYAQVAVLVQGKTILTVHKMCFLSLLIYSHALFMAQINYLGSLPSQWNNCAKG